ncbi:helix-hairpin-helix domain-containing protein [Ekhidna sp.]|uniref:ComEA family DNA-binding protein n=1 Tax=Ekhidna sp. TaxID=2608089 RepID=UPI0032976D08
MLTYFNKAISRALGFTKTESRGTLVLIFIIFMSIVSTQVRISYLKNQQRVSSDSSVLDWIDKAQASYDLKDFEEVKFDKSIFSRPNRKFPKTENKEVKKASLEVYKKEEKKIIIRDLNTASSTDLQEVRGIGVAFSERITKYRDLLGGFADTTQLKEVYGLKSETISELLKHFSIKSEVSPIDINSDSIKTLAGHPYISYDLARIIINYRKEHGDFNAIDDLRKIKAIEERTFLRLKPYLK